MTRISLALLSLAFVSACHSLTPLPVPSSSRGIEGYPISLQVTTRKNTRRVLHYPQVIGDSLVGFRTKDTTDTNGRIAIPISEVASVADRKFSGARTGFAIFSGVLAATFVVGLIAAIQIQNNLSHKA